MQNALKFIQLSIAKIVIFFFELLFFEETYGEFETIDNVIDEC